MNIGLSRRTFLGSAAMIGASMLHVSDGAASGSLTDSISLDVPCNGVSTTADGRTFLVLARIDGSAGPRVAEWKDGKLVPYPQGDWNDWADGKDPAAHFVRINSQRIGPDGHLWLVDVGAPAIGSNILPGGVKLVQIDVESNSVVRAYALGDLTRPDSFVDDVRFNGTMAYLTDAGVPALIVLNLVTGKGRRVLEGDKSVTAQKPIRAEGKTVNVKGAPVFIHADQLEVSPDGKLLYFQPCCGPLYSVETRFLNDASVDDKSLAARVSKFADTPSTGGTAIDASGNIYVSDTNELRIMKISPDGEMSVLIQDPRLLWVDAMWIDDRQRLWLPAAQLNRLAVFQEGVSKVDFPVHLYTIDIGQKPSPSDHK